jgi:RNase P/RNase MRP subunit POP5
LVKYKRKCLFKKVLKMVAAKMKAQRLKLKPSARDKRRYFLISGGSNEKIEKAILEYLGVLGFAKSAYLYVKRSKGRIVGSCLRGAVEDVRASLAFKKMKIEKVSGTLKGLGVQN